MEERFKSVFQEYEIYKSEHQKYHNLWRDCAVYVGGANQEVTLEQQTNAFTHGQQLGTEVFDSQAIKACNIFASNLRADLWPEGGKNVEMAAPPELAGSDAVKAYFERANANLQELINDPENGLAVSLDAYFSEQVAVGNGGIGCFKDDNGLYFEFWPIQRCFTGENKRGRVDRVFKHEYLPLFQIIEIYGLNSLSQKLREAAKTPQKLLEYHWILIYIKPRPFKTGKRKNNTDTSFQSLHFELDTKHFIKEGGFDEFPVKFGRLRKKGSEKYGSGVARDALPEIKEANFSREALMTGTEQTVQPPFILENDSLVGNVIDTSSQAVNIIDSDARNSDNPLRPLFVVGDLNFVILNIQNLHMSIDEHFHIDSVVDLKDQTRRTFSELQMRNQLRGRALTSIFTRQITEVFYPLAVSMVNWAFQLGALGVRKGSDMEQLVIARGGRPFYIPNQLLDLMDQGQSFYNLKFNTPAALALQAAQADAILEVARVTAELGKVDPETVIAYDSHKALKKYAEYKGAGDVIKSDEQFEKEIKAIKDQQQMQMQNEQLMNAAALQKAQNSGPGV